MSVMRKAATAALCFLAGAARAQTTQGEAFAQGKAYKPANAAIKSGINASAADEVPGQDISSTSGLTGLYGTNLTAPGQSKLAACAGYVPGSDAYKNAECDTINYIAGNPGTRPAFTIDRVNDPVIIRSNNIRNTPEVSTAGMSGLSGTYTACTNQTTNQPERYETERCQVGHPVIESQCTATLSVTYTWQRYAGQGAADLRYGYCGAGLIRGDRLAIPLTDSYRAESVPCSGQAHGNGVEHRIWYRDCAGNETLHGFDASACTVPPSPAVFDPPRNTIHSCTTAPRNNENCFAPAGQFVASVTVPVFEDHWDKSACADLEAGSAVIAN